MASTRACPIDTERLIRSGDHAPTASPTVSARPGVAEPGYATMRLSPLHEPSPPTTLRDRLRPWHALMPAVFLAGTGIALLCTDVLAIATVLGAMVTGLLAVVVSGRGVPRGRRAEPSG